MNQTDRIKAMLLKDRTEAPENLMPAVKSELFRVLSEYFDVNEQDFKMKVESRENGGYSVIITGTATRIYWHKRG